MAPKSKEVAGSSTSQSLQSLIRDEHGKYELRLHEGLLYPSNFLSRKIRENFEKSMYRGGIMWKDIPRDHKLVWFRELKKEFVWEPALDDAVESAFMEKAAKIFSNMCSNMKRNSRQKPVYLDDNDWAAWKNYWGSEKFKKKSEQASKNRRSEPGGPGTGIITHRGGSRSTVEYAAKVARERGCSLDDIPDYEIFNKYHTFNGEYTSQKSARIGEKYKSNKEVLTEALADEAASLSIEADNSAMREAAGGIKKRRIFGLGDKGMMIASRTSHPPPPPTTQYITREEMVAYYDLRQQRRSPPLSPIDS